IATAIGKLTSSITGLNAASLGTGLSRLGSIFGTGAGAVGGLSGVLGLGAFGTGLAITLSERELNERIEGMRRQGQPLEESLRQRQEEQALIKNLTGSDSLGLAARLKKLGAPDNKTIIANELDRITKQARSADEARRLLQEARQQNPAFNQALIDQQRLDRIKSTLSQATDATKIEKAASSAPQTEVQLLTDQIKDLNSEIAVLRSGTGQEFDLRIRKEALDNIDNT